MLSSIQRSKGHSTEDCDAVASRLPFFGCVQGPTRFILSRREAIFKEKLLELLAGTPWLEALLRQKLKKGNLVQSLNYRPQHLL